MSRYLYEKTNDYNTLRKELRTIEEDLKQSRKSSNPNLVSKPDLKTKTPPVDLSNKSKILLKLNNLQPLLRTRF